jgi:hypothetical protein
MRATLAFLNAAGSRRKLKSGVTDRGLLKLTDLLVTTGLLPGFEWRPVSRLARAVRPRAAGRRLK